MAEGLRSNLALQSQHLEVEKAAEALSEARARFFPELSFEARYTRADGGRVIDIPIGSALNPVYSTLNEMLVAQGQPARFPQVGNESIPFLRTEEQDTRVTAASAAICAGDSGRGSRSARVVGCEQLQSNGGCSRAPS